MDLLVLSILAQVAPVAPDFDLWGIVLKPLIASGPLAVVLGVACWRLWVAYQAALKEQADFLKRLIEGDRHGDSTTGSPN